MFFLTTLIKRYTKNERIHGLLNAELDLACRLTKSFANDS